MSHGAEQGAELQHLSSAWLVGSYEGHSLPLFVRIVLASTAGCRGDPSRSISPGGEAGWTELCGRGDMVPGGSSLLPAPRAQRVPGRSQLLQPPPSLSLQGWNCLGSKRKAGVPLLSSGEVTMSHQLGSVFLCLSFLLSFKRLLGGNGVTH